MRPIMEVALQNQNPWSVQIQLWNQKKKKIKNCAAAPRKENSGSELEHDKTLESFGNKVSYLMIEIKYTANVGENPLASAILGRKSNGPQSPHLSQCQSEYCKCTNFQDCAHKQEQTNGQ